MAEQLGEITNRLQNRIDRPSAPRAPNALFWQELNRELKAAKTKQEKTAIWQRYERELQEAQAAVQAQAATDDSSTRAARRRQRRQRRGSTLEQVQYRPLERNQRARLIFLAERLDAHTHEPGKHGGCLKRTGLQVLRVLLFHFHNARTGRCDPSLETIAKAAGMAKSTVAQALTRLEAAGILERIRRAHVQVQNGRRLYLQGSNAYRFNVPTRYRKEEGDFAKAQKSAESASRTETTTEDRNIQPPMPENVAASLARLGNAMAARAEMENARMKCM
jgi:DNA-binding MarR family transcriptional regulator